MNEYEIKKIKNVLENINFHLNKDEYPFSLNDLEHQNFLEAINIVNLNKIQIPEKKAIDYLKRGNAYFAKKKYKDALDNYSKAIEGDAFLLKAYLNRAFVYNKIGKLSEASMDFNFAIQLDQKCERAYSGIAVSYFYIADASDNEKDKYFSSIENFLKSIELKPDNAYSYNGIGWIYYCEKKNLEAIKNFNKAISLEPRFKNAYYNRGLSYMRIENYTQAIEDFTKGIKIQHFNNYFFYLSRSSCYKALGKEKEYEEDQIKANELFLKIKDTIEIKEIECPFFKKGVLYAS